MKHVLLLLILTEYVSPERFIYVTNPIVSMDFQILCLFFPFWKKGSLLPFICLRPDVHHSLHINHQSVAPFSPPPPPALNLFTFLSFPFLYRESRLIRRSLGLIFIKGSREGELAAGWGGGWLLQLFFIYRAGTKDKWILVFRTLKEIVKKDFLQWLWNHNVPNLWTCGTMPR